ncbi:ATP-binding cassette domain-containing protein [Geodermatophilus sp. CPCC 205761]
MIEVRGLTKRYGDVLAVDDLSFDVEPGRVTAFLGPNGAGKSTTMRMVLGPDRPTSGEALVSGRPSRRSPSRCARSVRCSTRARSTPAAATSVAVGHRRGPAGIRSGVPAARGGAGDDAGVVGGGAAGLGRRRAPARVAATRPGRREPVTTGRPRPRAHRAVSTASVARRITS